MTNKPEELVSRLDTFSKQVGTSCLFCMSKQTMSDSNLAFLQRRIEEGNLNEMLDVARVLWEQFPRLKDSSDAKRMSEYLMQDLQDKVAKQITYPINSAITSMATVIDRLKELTDKNPALIEQGFCKTVESLKSEFSVIKSTLQEPSFRIAELNQTINQLVLKPTVRGNFGEAVLMDRWLEAFPRDQVERAGGAGREDLTIIPYLSGASLNGSKYGERLSIERKTGKQRFNGSHQAEAIRHAKEKGASYALLVYDNQDNLPQTIQPVSIIQQDGVLIAVSDLQSGSWKIMREIIEVIQQELRQSNNVSAIDVNAIQQVISELASVVKAIEQVRGNSSKIKSCADEIDQGIATVKALVKSYENRLAHAITGSKDEANACRTTQIIS